MTKRVLSLLVILSFGATSLPNVMAQKEDKKPKEVVKEREKERPRPTPPPPPPPKKP